MTIEPMDDEPVVAPQPTKQTRQRAPAQAPQSAESFESARPVERPSGSVRDLPSSEEAEQHVIAASMLDDGETLDRAISEGISALSFFQGTNQIVFARLMQMRAEGKPIGLETLAQELIASKEMDRVGGFAYLIQVTDKAPTTAHAGYFIEKLKEKHLLREAIKAHTAAVEDAYSFTGGIEEYLRISQARVEAVSRATTHAKRADAMRMLEAHRVRFSTPPPEPTTRLWLADKPVSTAGNLTTLISRAKTGKTATLGAATAAIIAASSGTGALHDTFKFRASNPKGHAVIVIDTEQSPYDAWQCYERSLKRVAEPADPAWLHHYALVGYTVAELHQALDLTLERAKAAHGGIFAVILDGVADFVASVNDEAECNGLVTHLRKRTVDFDCPIICVIHSNEAEKSGDDGRGHLGKQLIRKAESNLLLKKTGDTTIITSDKQRKAPITEKDGVAFRWDDDKQMHVTCTHEGGPKGGRPQAYDFEDFREIFPTDPAKALTKQQLLRYAEDIAPIKETAFRTLLHEAYRNGQIIRTSKAQGFVYHADTP